MWFSLTTSGNPQERLRSTHRPAARFTPNLGWQGPSKHVTLPMVVFHPTGKTVHSVHSSQFCWKIQLHLATPNKFYGKPFEPTFVVNRFFHSKQHPQKTSTKNNHLEIDPETHFTFLILIDNALGRYIIVLKTTRYNVTTYLSKQFKPFNLKTHASGPKAKLKEQHAWNVERFFPRGPELSS